MNSCTFIGNLGKSPEVRFTKTGKAVASFSIGVKREWESTAGDKKEFTDWVNVVAWGKLGEYCGNNMDKGTRVIVHGRMQTRSYETADGTKKYVTEIIADFAAAQVDIKPNSGLDGMGSTVDDQEIPF